jgi:hypothetical protein
MTRGALVWQRIVEVDSDIAEICLRLEERLPNPQARDRLFEMLDLCLARKEAIKQGLPLP